MHYRRVETPSPIGGTDVRTVTEAVRVGYGYDDFFCTRSCGYSYGTRCAKRLSKP
jgi:hypothetical protein